MKRKNRPVRRLCAAGLLAVLAAVSWYENYTVRVLEQPIVSARLPEGFDGFRIAQISDLHAREFGKDNEHLVDLVRASKPDLIALTGDLADERRDPAALRPFLRALCAIASARNSRTPGASMTCWGTSGRRCATSTFRRRTSPRRSVARDMRSPWSIRPCWWRRAQRSAVGAAAA